MPDTTHTLARAGKVASFDLALFYVICAFVGMLGGSSRYDLMQVPILQVGLWAMLAVALFRMRDIPFGKGALVLAALYTAWLALQVIPLPHGVWTALPGRAALEQVEIALGSHQARPFSMVPHRSLNALGGAAAFLAPLVAAINLGRAAPRYILWALVALGTVSSLLALVQVQVGAPYFYAITNDAKPVGLFANSNHFAVCTALIIVAIGYATRFAPQKLQPVILIFTLVLVVSVLVGPSRAGLITLSVGVLAVGLMWIDRLPTGRLLGGRLDIGRMIAIAGIALVLLLALALANAERLPALERLLSADTFEDMRFAILPALLQMIGDFAPFGSGTGSFENAYYGFERREVMQGSYVNMAHNDLVQLLIEGGVFALGFVIAACWLVWSQLRRALLAVAEPRPLLIAVAAAVLIIVLASAADYPMRAPLFQAVVAMLLASLCAIAQGTGHKDGTSREPDETVPVTSA